MRFQERYRRRQLEGHRPLTKALCMAAGVAIVGVGLFMLAVPGPGLLALLIGAGLIAEESFQAARAFDWLELKLRTVARRTKRRLGWHPKT